MPWSDSPSKALFAPGRTIVTWRVVGPSANGPYDSFCIDLEMPERGHWHQQWPLSGGLLMASQLPEIEAASWVKQGAVLLGLAHQQLPLDL